MQKISSLYWLRKRTKWFALYIFFIFALFLGFNSLSPASAAVETQVDLEYNVKMTARSLFDGAYKYGDWLPIEITLENFGAATSVQVEATVNNVFNNSTFTTIFRRPISLGERSNKRFHFYIQPFVSNSNVSRFVSSDQTILLKTADGNRKLAEQTVRLLPISPKDYMVATISNDPTLISNLNNLKVGRINSRVGVSILGPADFPDRAEGWRSFDALVLSDTSTSGLSGDQQAALRDWVSAGGQLILMGGNGWAKVRNGFDKSLLPVDVYDYMKTDNLGTLQTNDGKSSALPQPVTLALGQVLQGAKALAVTSLEGDKNNTVVPLVTERRIGNGRVIATAMDLAASPLTDWDGSARIWTDIFNFNAISYYQIYDDPNPHLKNNSEFFGFVANVPEVPLPNIFSFLILFGIYIFIISPVHYFLLRKTGRLALGWITFPVITGLFMLGGIWLSTTQPPGDVLLSQMSVVQVSPGEENAEARSYLALFSPEERQYEISPQLSDTATPPLMLPLNRTYSSSFVDPDNTRYVVSGDEPRLERLSVGQWSAQGLSMETTLPARSFQLQNSLHFVDDNGDIHIKGTITNTLGQPIRGIILALGDQAQKLKDLEAGDSVNVDFALPSPTLMTMAYCSLGFGSYSSYSSTGVGEKLQNVLQSDRQNDKLYQNRAAFLRKLYESGRYSPVPTSRGLDFIGWLDNNPLPIDVPGSSTLPNASQVLIERLSVSSESIAGDGHILVPSTYMYPENVYSDQNLPIPTSRLDRTDQLCLNRGSVTVQYRLPVEDTSFRVTKMVLYINSFTANTNRNPALPTSIEFYDWQQKNWVRLASIKNSAVQPPTTTTNSYLSTPVPNELDDPGRFANPQTGQIIMRLTAPAPQLLLQFGIRVEGAHS